MKSPAINKKLTGSDHFSLFNSIFFYELHAIISSNDYNPIYKPLSRESKRRIKDNQKEIARIATEYFMENDGTDLSDESDVKTLINESILKALEKFK